MKFALATQAIDDCCRLACQGQQNVAVLVGHRVRHRNAALCQMLHEVEVERQLFVCETLKQGEHVLACAAGEKVIGVLNAALDTFEFDQLA